MSKQLVLIAAIVVTACGGGGGGNGPDAKPAVICTPNGGTGAPSVMQVFPTAFCRGVTVTLDGMNFAGTGSCVTVGGTAVDMIAGDTGSLTFQAAPATPSGMQTIKVTTGSGSFTVAMPVTVNDGAPPTITTFQPQVGASGDTVTITGTDLMGAVVSLHPIIGVGPPLHPTITANTATSIQFTIPMGVSGDYAISVDTAGCGTATAMGKLTT